MFMSDYLGTRKREWSLRSANFGRKSWQRTYNGECTRTELNKVRMTLSAEATQLERLKYACSGPGFAAWLSVHSFELVSFFVGYNIIGFIFVGNLFRGEFSLASTAILLREPHPRPLSSINLSQVILQSSKSSPIRLSHMLPTVLVRLF